MMTLTVIIVDVCVLTWLFQKIGVRCFTCGLLKSKLIYEHRRLLHLGFGRISGLMLPRKSSQNPLFRLYSVQRSTWSKWTRALEENDAKRIVERAGSPYNSSGGVVGLGRIRSPFKYCG
jgi:hypothetical protein